MGLELGFSHRPAGAEACLELPGPAHDFAPRLADLRLLLRMEQGRPDARGLRDRAAGCERHRFQLRTHLLGMQAFSARITGSSQNSAV